LKCHERVSYAEQNKNKKTNQLHRLNYMYELFRVGTKYPARALFKRGSQSLLCEAKEVVGRSSWEEMCHLGLSLLGPVWL
jgi:hypothetical protein